MDHLDSQITQRIQQQEEGGGVNIVLLQPGIKIEVQTRNTLYHIEILDPNEGKIKIQGGKYFPEPTEAYLHGSTWGGSMLKLQWIGHEMHMEIGAHKVVTTSAVQAAKVIGPNWEYRLDWNKSKE